jgi:hypothetical protein
MYGYFTVTRGTAVAMRLGYYTSAFTPERRQPMPDSAKGSHISTDPTTPSGFFRGLLRWVYVALREKELHRFAPTRVDRMIE